MVCVACPYISPWHRKVRLGPASPSKFECDILIHEQSICSVSDSIETTEQFNTNTTLFAVYDNISMNLSHLVLSIS